MRDYLARFILGLPHMYGWLLSTPPVNDKGTPIDNSHLAHIPARRPRVRDAEATTASLSPFRQSDTCESDLYVPLNFNHSRRKGNMSDQWTTTCQPEAMQYERSPDKGGSRCPQYCSFSTFTDTFFSSGLQSFYTETFRSPTAHF